MGSISECACGCRIRYREIVMVDLKKRDGRQIKDALPTLSIEVNQSCNKQEKSNSPSINKAVNIPPTEQVKSKKWDAAISSTSPGFTTSKNSISTHFVFLLWH
jgi:hypothetical protein